MPILILNINFLNTMWQELNNKLYRSFTFTDFRHAFNFITNVADLAQHHNHHPTWTNTYNKVEIWLSTHDAGDVITHKDRELAAAIDDMVLEIEGKKQY